MTYPQYPINVIVYICNYVFAMWNIKPWYWHQLLRDMPHNMSIILHEKILKGPQHTHSGKGMWNTGDNFFQVQQNSRNSSMHVHQTDAQPLLYKKGSEDNQQRESRRESRETRKRETQKPGEGEGKRPSEEPTLAARTEPGLTRRAYPRLHRNPLSSRRRWARTALTHGSTYNEPLSLLL